MNEATREIIVKLSQLTKEEREVALASVVDHFCIRCGEKGDFHHSLCDCDEYASGPPTPRSEPVMPCVRAVSFHYPEPTIDWSGKRLY